MSDWLSLDELERSDCKILDGSLDSIDQAAYESIEIRLTSCDVHCKYADSDRDRVYYDNYTNVTTSIMEDPNVRSEDITSAKAIILTSMAILFAIIGWRKYRYK